MQDHGGDLERVDSTPLHGPAVLRRESSVNTEKVDADKVLLEVRPTWHLSLRWGRMRAHLLVFF
jgi:hypothetical protein